jgi:hypothetical protein
MTLLDWFQFWVGDAAAIERLAGNPWTPAIGALFVLSAGLARNHDVHDLVDQSHRLFLPFAASLLAAAILYGVLRLITADALLSPVPFWSLLGLFWLTAPLAWLYGLPYERIWPRETAAGWRRAALMVVSLARVTLITRCLVVLGQGDLAASLGIAAGFLIPMGAIALMLTSALVLAPEERMPNVTMQAELRRSTARLGDGMAMIPRDDAEVPMPPGPRHAGALEHSAGMDLGAALGCGAGLLVAAFLVLLTLVLRNRWQPLPLAVNAAPPSAALWTFAIVANGFWLAMALWRQPVQRRRSNFVRRLQTEPLADVLRDLDRRTPGNFPPHWDPAAVLAREPCLPRFVEALIESHKRSEASWVRTAFASRLERILPRLLDHWNIWLFQDNRASETQLRTLERLYEFLASHPAPAKLLAPHREYLHQLTAFMLRHDPPRGKILERILALATTTP